MRSFVKEYGVDDAVMIVSTAFSFPRDGKLNGQPIGTSLFSSRMRWYANMLLAEGGVWCDGYDSGPTWEDLARQQEAGRLSDEG